MENRSIFLKPFSNPDLHKEQGIEVTLKKHESSLEAAFCLRANLEELELPGFDPVRAQRKNRLWDNTCFEIFLGQRHESGYREFNLSPSGDWNVYTFKGGLVSDLMNQT